jgi:hypothetical protein
MNLAYLKKILRPPRTQINSSVLDASELQLQERERFRKYSWDFDAALTKLNTTLRSLNFEEYREEEDISRHEILFSAIRNHHQVNHILEIGTYTGESTFLLSHLFPEAKILTVDLPDTDVVMIQQMQKSVVSERSEIPESDKRILDYSEFRSQNLSGRNIKFVQCNSFFLPNITDNKFDLIWVDGCHLYPEISWDICNAYHYCNIGGHILFDDILGEGIYAKTDRISRESREVLTYLIDRTGIDIDFFLKRTDKRSLSDRVNKKYLGVIRKYESI